MTFKKLTGEKLVKFVKENKLRELKADIEDEIVEKVTEKISKKKAEILSGIQKNRGGKKK